MPTLIVLEPQGAVELPVKSEPAIMKTEKQISELFGRLWAVLDLKPEAWSPEPGARSPEPETEITQ
jgi:hypothetical protein